MSSRGGTNSSCVTWRVARIGHSVDLIATIAPSALKASQGQEIAAMIGSLSSGGLKPLRASQARRQTAHTNGCRTPLVVRAAETYSRDFSKAPRLIQVRSQAAAIISPHLQLTGLACLCPCSIRTKRKHSTPSCHKVRHRFGPPCVHLCLLPLDAFLLAHPLHPFQSTTTSSTPATGRQT